VDQTAYRLGLVCLLAPLTKEECAVSMAVGVDVQGGVALTVVGLARSLESRFPKL
jgi:hypothetical protein